MPNWCSNTLTITSTKEKIAQISKELDDREGKEFFDIFAENAEAAGQAEEWYSYNLNTYGCKWNCDANDWMVVEGITGDQITILFDSPWGPPINLYNSIHNEEIDVEAEYFEPGMCFVGSYFNGEDTYYEYNDISSKEVYDHIPAELVDSFGIYEMMVENEENNMEDEDEDDKK